MTPQTSGGDTRKGKAGVPAAEPCQYAACTRLATDAADGWVFCRQHLREHQALQKDSDWVFTGTESFRVLRPCGTLAAAKRHRRRGEDLCDACRDAERAKHGYKTTSQKRWAS